ncbi:MAG: endonuclease/exonuclease/phosphatase family protein [Chloroflexi bacterium]|nr:endonuclease/exonuclease/phosphatase family protein [Chloroflexota bacterium]MBA3740704.1 endonuclease/exonuclease/phosphatase family protein [Chloroflexota bacterium]
MLATPTEAKGPPDPVRFATFNASLNRASAGLALSDLSVPYSPAESNATVRLRRAQAANVAETIQRVRPEVLLINEFDFEPGNALAIQFQNNYLSVSQNGATPITYPYVFVAPSNTGVPSGRDLNNNGSVGGPDDALGFGFFAGQFGMAVFSQHPIAYDEVRTFREFLWKDMPGALLPDDPATNAPADWYDTGDLALLPLSSKSHWDVPIDIGGTEVHFLVSHPTPPVFDGAEDRNGRRNHDEIRLWADYITPGAGDYLYDDAGGTGGLHPGAKFVIAGDQNSDPLDGDSIPGSIQQLLNSPQVNTGLTPASAGAAQQAGLQGGANAGHRGDPRFDTADFADSAPGNLRVDYVLPSRNLRIVDGAVFWPLASDPLFRLVGVFTSSLPGGFPSSDHRLVWIDVMVPGSVRRN